MMKAQIIRTIIHLLLVVLFVGVGSNELYAQTSKKKSKKSKSSATKTQMPEPTLEEKKTEEKTEKPDPNVKPSPLGSTPFVFPRYEEFTLPDGLHVFVVENHQLPTITFSLLIRAGDLYDPQGKEGVAAMTGDMMSKGTTQHSAAQIAEILDGVGATLSVETSGEAMTISGAALKKHSDLLYSMLGEQLTTPLFDEAEIEKLRKQYLASVANQKSRSIEVAQALSRKVIYGFNNQLARIQSESSINSIKKSDISRFFNLVIKPNNASIAIVGDVTVKEAKALLSKHLNKWEKGNISAPENPELHTERQGVYFVARPGAVQSTIIVCTPAPSRKDERFMALDLTSTYLGGGFGSVLFSTLREKYSYTYSPFAFLTQGVRYNRFALGSEVRSSVTDSTISVILRELKKLDEEGPDEEILKRSIAIRVGRYKLSLEQASTIASYLQNGWFIGIPMDEVEREVERIEAVSYGDVSEAVRKYLGMFDLRIVVVGNPAIRGTLERFGPVYDYTLDLEPAVAEEYQRVDMSVDDIVRGYQQALGGEAAVNAVQSAVMNGRAVMSMQGRDMDGTVVRKWKSPNKDYFKIDLSVMQQMQSTNGVQAWVSLNRGPAGEADAEETKRIILEARLFPVLSWQADGYKTSVKGKKGDFIVVEAMTPIGKKDLYFFNTTSMLLSKTEKEEQTPGGSVTIIEKFDNYVDVAGVKFPTTVVTQTPIYTLSFSWDIQLNLPLTDQDFIPQETR